MPSFRLETPKHQVLVEQGPSGGVLYSLGKRSHYLSSWMWNAISEAKMGSRAGPLSVLYLAVCASGEDVHYVVDWYCVSEIPASVTHCRMTCIVFFSIILFMFFKLTLCNGQGLASCPEWGLVVWWQMVFCSQTVVMRLGLQQIPGNNLSKLMQNDWNCSQ